MGRKVRPTELTNAAGGGEQLTHHTDNVMFGRMGELPVEQPNKFELVHESTHPRACERDRRRDQSPLVGAAKQAFDVRTLQLPVNSLDYGQSWSKRATSHGQTGPQAGIASQRITGSSTSTDPEQRPAAAGAPHRARG